MRDGEIVRRGARLVGELRELEDAELEADVLEERREECEGEEPVDDGRDAGEDLERYLAGLGLGLVRTAEAHTIWIRSINTIVKEHTV